jgi:hypothetical protein
MISLNAEADVAAIEELIRILQDIVARLSGRDGMTVREMVVFLEVAAGANTATGRTDRAGLTAYAKVNVRLSDRAFSVRGCRDQQSPLSDLIFAVSLKCHPLVFELPLYLIS